MAQAVLGNDSIASHCLICYIHSSSSSGKKSNMERSNDNTQHLIQPQNTYQRFFKSALDYAAKAYDTVTAPQIPRDGAESTEETPPSSPTLPIPGAYHREPYSSGRFSTVLASDFPARTIQHLDEPNVTDNQAGGVDQNP
ncbi:hypothetical protein M378DRAFT_953439 [Amanita muscaria Koide BX008]|uniref:Uncharacterized protein n=1 Tax=Amanita muscaria (strain Koide BX008) TaxID=946122 RepID=A0A0C2T147_AMAMK|nr:hypothetical protein M378DRAFT_953439 [Amanita muscaria Koide BX008]